MSNTIENELTKRTWKRESKEEQYPILDLVINTKNEAIQYHIEFLKTDEGYRLISVDLN